MLFVYRKICLYTIDEDDVRTYGVRVKSRRFMVSRELLEKGWAIGALDYPITVAIRHSTATECEFAGIEFNHLTVRGTLLGTASMSEKQIFNRIATDSKITARFL